MRLIDYLNKDWQLLLQEEFEKEYFIILEEKIKNDYLNKKIFPNKEDIFRIYNDLNIKDIKVVILGQDPYHGRGQAIGYSFAVPSNSKLPPSLRNILKEVQSDIEGWEYKDSNLEHWVKQGVFMLNTTLTVEEGKANSHGKYGWTKFTDATIRIISEHCENVVFVLWGNHAISKESLIDNSKHKIIKSVHPSPLSAHGGFFGSKPFSNINRYLQEKGILEIDW